MLFGIVVFIFVVVCIFLILLVLVQSDKGGGISSAFGGGLSNASALLGTQDTKNILTRATTIFATLFMGLSIIISLVLANYAARGEQKSVLKARAEKQESFAPSQVLQPGGLPIQSENQDGARQPAPGSVQPVAPAQEIPQGVPLPIQPAEAPQAPAPAANK